MSENTEAKDLLVQINQLKAALKDKNEKIMGKMYLCMIFDLIWMIATETKLARFKELLENRLKEIEVLQMELEESQCINGI